MTCRADFELNLLTLMALNHELGALEGRSLQIVDKDGSIGVFLRHLGSILPGKQVLGTVFWGDSRVQRTKFKTIKLAVDEGWRFFLVLAFAREASMNLSEWCCEVIVLEDGDRGRLYLHANALIIGPLHCLDAFFGRHLLIEDV